MKHLLSALLLSLALMAPANTPWSELPVKDIINTLDTYLRDADKYDANVRARIFEQKLRLWGQPTHNRDSLYFTIGKMYSHVDIDSALRYYDLGMKVAELNKDDSQYMRLRLEQLQMLPYKGLVHQALEAIDAIDPAALPQRLLGKYYYTRHLIYQNSFDAESPDSVRAKYSRIAHEALDSAMTYPIGHSQGADIYPYWKGLMRPESVKAEYVESGLRGIIDTLSLENELMPLLSSMLAFHYRENGNIAEAIRYYAVSAISDILQGKAESTSLHRLGGLMSEQGDNRRAYRYLTTSLNRAVASGARLRALEAAQSLPLVIRTTEKGEAQNRRLMVGLIIALSLFVITLAVALVNVHRHRKRQKDLRERLARANDSKDAYIEKMLEICANNIDSVENFNRIAARKIKASQTSDLLRMLEKDEFVQKQLQDFYNAFDPAFLAIYPDFVERINTLLDPEFRYAPITGQSLNAELRMLALMMMGITESPRLARFLGLNVNSVYTYRTKLKNRATDRENFDENVRNLSRIC